jgi:hypothetical protein
MIRPVPLAVVITVMSDDYKKKGQSLKTVQTNIWVNYNNSLT